MKKIQIIPMTKEVELAGIEPQPAVKFIPNWYKKINPFTNGDKKLKFQHYSKTHNTSIKKCIPFVDAMTAGYIFSLNDDIYVEILETGEPYIRWKSEVEIVTMHSAIQWEGFLIPQEFHQMIAKWHNDWQIKTPDGYSLLAIHPLNRTDLPFYTLSGLVDTDKYEKEIHFPFMLRRDFEGIIPAGTPLVQLIPIKRDSFKSSKKNFDADDAYKKKRKFTRTFSGSYQKNFWLKKHYG